MPPWEMVKALLSLMVTDGVSQFGEELELGIFDISRAHFIPEADRELYIEIPEEDRSAEDGDCIGRLKHMMYGMRTAANAWMRDWQKVLEFAGYAVGRANPALFYNKQRDSRGAVHGDDFYVLGGRTAVDHIASVLAAKYDMRESYRLGFGAHCKSAARVLNRVVSLHFQNGRKVVQIEPDARHADLIIRTLGLDGDKTKTLSHPSAKPEDSDVERFKFSPVLPPESATSYRSNVMRASFVAQDRADLGEAVKRLAQHMSKPTVAAMEELKRLGRYLKGQRSVALRFEQQRKPTALRVSVDSDFAADRATRRSTTGMVQRLGQHPIKASSNLQGPKGLNVSESEYYALVHGAAHGLGCQAYLKDLGVDVKLVIESDSNAARAFASRKGLGKQRHVQTRFLWLQDQVAMRSLHLERISGQRNVADILTKKTTTEALRRHLTTLGYKEVARHALQLKD